METALRCLRSGDWHRSLLELDVFFGYTRCPGLALHSGDFQSIIGN